MARMCKIDNELESVQTFDGFDPEMAQTCVRALTGAIPYQVLPVAAELEDAKPGCLIGFDEVEFIFDKRGSLAM